MQYSKTVQLKDGRECLVRNAQAADAQEVVRIFDLTHGQTEYLLSYPDENSLDVEQEHRFLAEQEASGGAVYLCAFVDGWLAGTASVGPVGEKSKVKHRAEFGISIDRGFWGLGIGRALTESCAACARQAGYAQLELDVVGSNERALALYRSVGFVEYGRNPRGFRTRGGAWQELVLMRLELRP